MRTRLTTCLAAALALAAAAPAASAASREGARPDCFMLSQWRGWSSPNPRTIYLRVGFRDVYQLDLRGEAPDLTWPDARLINEVRGTSSVCGPLDLDLRVKQGAFGPGQPLFVDAIRKLTPDEVAAIPKKYLPQ